MGVLRLGTKERRYQQTLAMHIIRIHPLHGGIDGEFEYGRTEVNLASEWDELR